MTDKKPPKHPQNPQFTADLLALIERHKLSEQSAAALLGVPVYTLKKWTTGERSPSAATVRLLEVFQTLETLAPAMLAGFIPGDSKIIAHVEKFNAHVGKFNAHVEKFNAHVGKFKLMDTKMNAIEHYDRLYGNLGLSPKDAAKWVFASGWNSALSELIARLSTIDLDPQARASFAVYFQQMMHVDPSEIERTMQ